MPRTSHSKVVEKGMDFTKKVLNLLSVEDEHVDDSNIPSCFRSSYRGNSLSSDVDSSQESHELTNKNNRKKSVNGNLMNIEHQLHPINGITYPYPMGKTKKITNPQRSQKNQKSKTKNKILSIEDTIGTSWSRNQKNQNKKLSYLASKSTSNILQKNPILLNKISKSSTDIPTPSSQTNTLINSLQRVPSDPRISVNFETLQNNMNQVFQDPIEANISTDVMTRPLKLRNPATMLKEKTILKVRTPKAKSFKSKFNVDITKDIHTDKTNDIHIDTTKDIHTDKTNGIHIDTTKDIHTDKTNDIHIDTTKDIHTDKTNDIHTDISKDIYTDTTKDIHTETTKDSHPDKTTDINTDKTTDINTDITKDIHKNIPKNVHLSATHNIQMATTQNFHIENNQMDQLVNQNIQSIPTEIPKNSLENNRYSKTMLDKESITMSDQFQIKDNTLSNNLNSMNSLQLIDIGTQYSESVITL